LKTLRIYTVLAGGAALAATLSISPRLSIAADPPSVEHASGVPDSQIPKYIVEAINSPDRPGADKELDKARAVKLTSTMPNGYNSFTSMGCCAGVFVRAMVSCDCEHSCAIANGWWNTRLPTFNTCRRR
jgi:hypothetical protein